MRWLREVWAVEPLIEAVALASPLLAARVHELAAVDTPNPAEVQRVTKSVARYALRAGGRATPFGLFAGVCRAQFGDRLDVPWGADHHQRAHVVTSWLADTIDGLEALLELRPRLRLVANTMVFVRGGRLVVPHPPRRRQDHAVAETSMVNTPAVQRAMSAATTPIQRRVLAEKLAAEFSSTPHDRIDQLVDHLVEHRALLSDLHAPAGIHDALAHLVAVLDEIGASDLPTARSELARLRGISVLLARHNDLEPATTYAEDRRELRATATALTAAVRSSDRSPLAVDLRLDCAPVLPARVAREAEAAASTLARLSAHPGGTPAWQRFHNRFFERYGVDALVPLRDVVDPDIGIGFPDGFLGADPEPPAEVSARDRRLLAIAQTAALEGATEIVLDDELIAELAPDVPKQLPPHLELCFRIRAVTSDALQNGVFELEIRGVSRAAGTMTGRFLDLLTPADRDSLVADLHRLPVSEPGSLPVQLAFSPLKIDDLHVTRAPELLPVISLAEHRSSLAITVDDLAVSCDRRRLHLVWVSRGLRVEPTVLHALDLRGHTPPMARFLAEVGRAQSAVVSMFDWGTASSLPFLPRLRHGRTVLSPARWLLDHAVVTTPVTDQAGWSAAFEQWREARGVPRHVVLTEQDARLPLDLDHPAHQELLRAQLTQSTQIVLEEDRAAEGGDGWFADRAHEVVVALTTPSPPTPHGLDRAPAHTSVRGMALLDRRHGRLPGRSNWIHAKVYLGFDRHAEVLTAHLPRLLNTWPADPRWWFIRYRDPRPHLRLRIALVDAADFADAAARISGWADDLRQAGLLGDLLFATSYPEVGRWGDGELLGAAEEVFAADSRALLVQLSHAEAQPETAMVAAGLFDIACAFTGSTAAGAAWLIDHARLSSSTPLPRDVMAEALRLADPHEDWAGLRGAPGGTAIQASWAARRRALGRYRELLDARASTTPRATAATATPAPVQPGAAAPDPISVLDGLLHAHHLRAVGIDRDHEQLCLRLARAAARTWTARRLR